MSIVASLHPSRIRQTCDPRRLHAVTRTGIAWLRQSPGTPHQVALGVAIGVFVAFTPTLGAQMAIAGVMAGLMGASVRAALPMVWITNPLTAAPLYLMAYQVGVWCWPFARDVEAGVEAELILGGEIVGALVYGGLILGAALGAASYFTVRVLLTRNA